MNTAISSSKSISMAWNRARLSGAILPASERRSNRAFSVSNSSLWDCLLDWLCGLLSLDGHHGRHDREAFRPGQCLVVSSPVCRLALDALPVGEILASKAGPVHPGDGEIKPELFGAHATLVHDLQFGGAPSGKQVVVQG